MARLKRKPTRQVVVAACIGTIVIFSILAHQPAETFRVSFRHRLLKSIQQHSNPQLNPPDTLIRPIECRNANNHSEAGICMFSIDCMQNKGVPLSICKHNYFVGTCCKLPDYNNFVGIVYDLRETETANQQLEARRSASGQLDSNTLNALKLAHKVSPVKVSQLQLAHNSDGQQRDENSTAASTQRAQEISTSESPSDQATLSQLERRSTVSQHAETDELFAASSAQQNQQPSSTVKPADHLAEKLLLDEKYIISSTKLFHDSQFSTTFKPLNNVAVLPPASGIAIETGRNADGSSQQISLANSDAIKQINNETSSMKPTLAQVAFVNSNNEQQVGAYEVVSAQNKTIDEPSSHSTGLDISQEMLVSSAHSAPNRLNLQHQQQQQHQQNSVYLLTEEADSNSQKNAPTSIVFSSNHQPSSEPLRHQQQAQLVSRGPSSASDQEFTLSTAAERSDESSQSLAPTVVSASSSLSPTSTSAAISHASSMSITTTATSLPNDANNLVDSPTTPSSAVDAVQQSTLSASSAPVAEVTSSPFVDLVSSVGHSTVQTTTPFTSSLSTAILPNVSSHPYSPTTLAPTPSPSTSSSQPSSSSASTQQQQQALVSSQSSSSKQPAVGTISHEAPSSSSLAPLFYSTAQASNIQQQHQSSSSEASNSDGVHQPSAHLSRPIGSSGLQAASKIVTGNSGTNNLIPGLSGLHSAILAHIPFKIPSGLSSGLQSYLQAAMKPNGAHRPLISSNTAPALQYQHSNNNGSVTHSSKPSSQSAGFQQSAIRFPMPSSTTSSTTPPLQATSGAPDYQREAQLVCGRPQVNQQEASVSKKRVARIVGGNQSSFGQWPWMVSLRQWRKGAFLHKCGAALLNENWAITAAHCVENVKAPDLLLRLGEFDVSNQNEPFPYTERRVKQVVSHPSFDPKTFEYDLALIKFTETVQFERNIIPVCVPSGNDSYVDRMATVIGWGRLYEDGPLPDVIQHVDVPIITNQECEKMYKNAGFVEEIPEMFICAGISKGGRDSCEGDSGGPLTMVDHDGRSYLVGIISWGIGCALPSQPGVYTRITAFSPWINSIIST